ncbi:hypothetical protein MC28_G134 (plasmid) [Bacillus thuringiensis MC28]|nr:hypothetical protein MC28_G134 [Bacillus thuringiensis MC28]
MHAIFIARCFVNKLSHTDDIGSISTQCKECNFMTPISEGSGGKFLFIWAYFTCGIPCKVLKIE